MRKAAVVPAFNESGSIAEVVSELRDADPDFEVIVVDAGSTDGTAELARAAGATVVRLPDDVGIGAAGQTGIRYVAEHDFDVAVQIEGGPRHDARKLAKILEPVLAGRADIATTSGLRAMNHQAIRLLAADYPDDHSELEATVLVRRHGLTMVEVPGAMPKRERGRSTLTAFRSIYSMVRP